ncbi:hypothetical protein ASG90_16280 [Nocardioides sp. Soil797]|nr:hypothetical protein ASG90_16280 [Nocardioides sp. Soil797]
MNEHLRRATALLPWLLGLLVLVLAVSVWAVEDTDERPHADVGDLFTDADSPAPLAHAGEARLPWATLDVAARASDSLPDLNGGRPNLQAPDDGSFVHVQVHATPATNWVGTTWPYANETEVVLRADEHDYALTGANGFLLSPDDSSRGQQDRWVAVEGHPKELAIVVRIDGEEQVVHTSDGTVDLGRAEDLEIGEPHTDNNRSPVRCGRFTRADEAALGTSGQRFIECQVAAVTRTPYADGLGWAEPGHEFVAIELNPPLSVGTYVPGQSRKAITLSHYSERLSFSARLAGRRPVADPDDVRRPWQYGTTQGSAQFVFDVAEGEPIGDLVFTTHVDAQPNSGFDDKPAELLLRWTIPGRKLT